MNNHKLNASPIDAKTHNAAIFPLTTNFTTPEYNGGPYVPYHNNQNPRLDLKTVYSPMLTHRFWFSLLCAPVIASRLITSRRLVCSQPARSRTERRSNSEVLGKWRDQSRVDRPRKASPRASRGARTGTAVGPAK